MEIERRLKEKARRDREAVAARGKYLDNLVGHEAALWAEIDGLIATKQPKKYDRAVTLLADLRDLDMRRKGGDFGVRIEALKHAQSGKPSFIERIKRAGL